MTTPSEVFEPADPARAMPKWLIIGAVIAMLLAALLFNWLNNRSLEAPDEVIAEDAAAPAPAPAETAPPQGQGPVVVTATDTAWIEVKDGDVLLKQGELAAGQTFAVPANAVAPTLTTAKPEALRITVGPTVAPMIGEPAKKVTVSLKGEDLLRPRPAASAPAPEPAAAAPQPAPARPAPRRAATPPPPQPAPPPAEPQPEPAEPSQTPQQ